MSASSLTYLDIFGEEFNLPDNLEIIIVDDLPALAKASAANHIPGNAEMFGTAFLQGERLNFTTAMPWELMLSIGIVSQASTGAGLDEVRSKSNRPKQGAHGANLRKYLKENACAAGNKWIVPAVTMNFGAVYEEDETHFRATLIIVANKSKTVEHGACAWTAMLVVPNNIKLHVTDGGHRVNQSKVLLDETSAELTLTQRAVFLGNAIDVRIVFEPDAQQAQQDFADCGRAKPIAGSQIAAYDRRDGTNEFTTNLVLAVPFLREHIDATAAGVNLSARSVKCWPLASLRGMIDIINRLARERIPTPKTGKKPDAFDPVRLDGIMAFFNDLVAKVPTLNTINEGWLAVKREEKKRDEVMTAADLRTLHGGDVVLRASFLAICAKAFDYTRVHAYDPSAMVDHLAATDWHVLICSNEDFQAKIDADKAQAEAAGTPPTPYNDLLSANLNPALRPLVVMREGARYRLSAGGAEVNAAWTLLSAEWNLPAETPQKLAA